MRDVSAAVIESENHQLSDSMGGVPVGDIESGDAPALWERFVS
jgi:hypothetical protein